ncbi:hypothetical protein PFISCL1PPCAC_20278, partial [Pristionchus fissidentatus]
FSRMTYAGDLKELNDFFGGLYTGAPNNQTPLPSAPVQEKLPKEQKENGPELVESLLGRIDELEKELKECKKEVEMKNKNQCDCIMSEDSERIFRVIIPNVSRILGNGGAMIYSKPINLGATWRIGVGKNNNNQLTVCLSVDDNTMRSEMLALSINPTLISMANDIFTTSLGKVFKSFTLGTKSWTWKTSISIEKLFDRCYRFIENDSILLKIDMRVYS